MKLQEVFLRAIARKITWPDAAEIAGLSYSAVHRIRQKYEEHGYDGLFWQTSRKRQFYRVPLATVERVLVLYQERYSRTSARDFHEKLKRRHGIDVQYTWLEQALRGAGLISDRGQSRHVPRTDGIAAPDGAAAVIRAAASSGPATRRRGGRVQGRRQVATHRH